MIKRIIPSIHVLCFVAINSVLLNLSCAWIQSSKSAFVHTPVLASWLWESTFVHLQPLHPHQCQVYIYLPMPWTVPTSTRSPVSGLHLSPHALDSSNLCTLTSVRFTFISPWLGQFQPLHAHQCQVYFYLPMPWTVPTSAPSPESGLLLSPHAWGPWTVPTSTRSPVSGLLEAMKALGTCNIYIYTLTSEHQDVVHFQPLQCAAEGRVHLFSGERARGVSIYLVVNGLGACLFRGDPGRGICSARSP